MTLVSPRTFSAMTALVLMAEQDRLLEQLPGAERSFPTR